MKKIIFITRVVCTLFLIILIAIQANKTISEIDEIGKPLFKKKQLNFPNKKVSLYLKSKNWGLTGDHKITVLSKNPQQEFHPDTTSEYIFNGFEEIIYCIEKNTLKIFSWQSPKKPEKFDSEIQIKWILIENNTEWNSIKEKTKKNYSIFD